MTGYTIVGAGAIGGTLAWSLAGAGHDVRLVDTDPGHVAAIRQHGLLLERDGVRTPMRIPVSGVDDEQPSALGKVLLAVKANATAEAAAWVASRLSADGCVVSVQNGLNEQEIAEAVGQRRTVGAFVNLFADVVEPGVIRDGGAGALRVGELSGCSSERVGRLVRDLQSWGPAEETANVSGYLWSKLAFGAVLTATALVDAPMAELIDRYRALVEGLVLELSGLAALQGIELEPFDAFVPGAYGTDRADAATDRLVAWLRTQSKDRSGIWRDLAVRMRPTEVPAQYGPVLGIADRLGHPMPLMASVLAQIEQLEGNPAAMSEQRLSVLEREAMR